MPNVGKSTLINRLRNFHLKQGNAVQIGAEPGITRSVQSKVKVIKKILNKTICIHGNSKKK